MERLLRDLTETVKQTEEDKENVLMELQSTETKVAELENEAKDLQKSLEEGERALQASERAKERIEVQFQRTQETIRLQVSNSYTNI